jgi:hypothetical protein
MKFSDKATIWFLLFFFGSLFFFTLIGIIDAIYQQTFSTKSHGKVIDIQKLYEDEYLVHYSYFNEHKDREYFLSKKINKKACEIIGKRKTVQLEYVSYFPRSPKLASIEHDNSFILLIPGVIVIFIGLYRIVLALKGRIEVSDLV